LALHRLSSLDVIVARANAQAEHGMRLVMESISRLRPPDAREVRMVQTMVPLPFENPVSKAITDDWLNRMYAICLDTVYRDSDDVPQVESDGAHLPILSAYREEFSRYDSISQVPNELLPSFDRLVEELVPERFGEEV
jgi:hypothetical protein